MEERPHEAALFFVLLLADFKKTYQISDKSTNLSHFSSVKSVEFITQEEEDVVIDNDLIGDR